MQMLGWEEPLLAAIADVRRQEMRYCGRMNHIRASNMALQFLSVPLFAFITFTTVCDATFWLWHCCSSALQCCVSPSEHAARFVHALTT